ncbi:venom dipeptidyl peptidase 4 isoform X2 [Monomorium pharaonis]|uniref:venom dipeptidyl peptidase 4 isoform X2 n=1 Tax=Monomorium pharaonis TaxID=307658 RepID=UPI001747C55D|nr:venom dipeptidyl peptidase 4 isoform X2 [Monomorium pharaonis]
MQRHVPLQLLILCAFVITIGQSRIVPRVNDTYVRNKDDNQYRKPFSLEETYLHVFYSFGFNGVWISDHEIMIVNISKGNITIFDVKTGNTTQFFDGINLPVKYKFSTAAISANRQYILFGYNIKPMFRYSTIQNYVIYDRRNGTFTEIANEAFISVALWSPIGSDLVYVLDNDIYHMNFNRDQNVVRRLTTNGKPKIVYNGIPDWIYEEEVFSSGTAIWYSPDGQHLAFASFNDTLVKDIVYSYYGTPGSFKDQYPTEVKIKYPKVGTQNPVVSLSVIDLTNSSSVAITLEAPIHVVTSDHVLYNVNWWDETHVIATWTNRVQNQSQMMMYNIWGDAKSILYDEETKGWLRPNKPIRVGDYALLLRFEHSGTSAGRFYHINRYEFKDGQFVTPMDLTPGPSEVRTILAADLPRGRVYYLATAPGKPTQRNLYSVPLDGSQRPTCISCKLLTLEGNKCVYATASFSSQRSYYALTCSGPNPTMVTINDAENKSLLFWNINEDVRMILSLRQIPQRKDFNITVNGYDSRVRLLLPPDFDEGKSYPLLVFVRQIYAGPNSVRIIDDAKIGYEHYLTTNRKVVCVWIDARGSAFKGSKMLFEIYRKMGTVEVEDTIAITAILQKRYKWIDANRTGIYGWSYGGFTTGMVMAQDVNSVFKCGISIAPVTSWIYYDSIYTERYMGLPTPEDNLHGYNRTDLSQRTNGIRGKKYMLIHGSADDNVHYQQAMMLAKALEHNDILFEQITYTDEAHSLERVSPHLYHTMDKFWGECFRWESR